MQNNLEKDRAFAPAQNKNNINFYHKQQYDSLNDQLKSQFRKNEFPNLNLNNMKDSKKLTASQNLKRPDTAGLSEIENKSLETFVPETKTQTVLQGQSIKDKEVKSLYDNFREMRLKSSERQNVAAQNMQAVITNMQQLQQKLEYTEAQREANKYSYYLNMRNYNNDNKDQVNKKFRYDLIEIQGKLVNEDIVQLQYKYVSDVSR